MPSVLRRSASPGALLVALALGLAGCQTARPNQTGVSSNPAPGTQGDVARAAAHWRERFERSPGDEQAAFGYARALLAQDARAQAVAVLRRAVLANQQSRLLKGELGKALAANGQLAEALAMFGQAHSPDRPDWRILSAHGAVLDQMGRPQEARSYYEAALRLAPSEPSVQSNFGLSLALAGDLQGAERQLRAAADNPRADARVRQNLALVVALQGRFPEAEALARRDLSPAEAERNVAAIRDMVRRRGAAGPRAPVQPSPERSAAAPPPSGGYAAQAIAAENDRRSGAAEPPAQLIAPSVARPVTAQQASGAREPPSLLSDRPVRQQRVSASEAASLLGPQAR
jgi:Flp pilus assembly protein TadD